LAPQQEFIRFLPKEIKEIEGVLLNPRLSVRADVYKHLERFMDLTSQSEGRLLCHCATFNSETHIRQIVGEKKFLICSFALYIFIYLPF
jgi:hypothetical protein